jgi:trk system potassium uptake protein TrkH
MNFRLVSRLLSIVSALIGVTMVFSLPWAIGGFGHRTGEEIEFWHFESRGFFALLGSMVVCGIVSGVLYYFGRHASGRLFRKEAMAVVGLSWLLATALGALPYELSSTYRCSGVRLMSTNERPQVYDFNTWKWKSWREMPELSDEHYSVIRALNEAGAPGLSEMELIETTARPEAVLLLEEVRELSTAWRDVVREPRRGVDESQRAGRYRIRWVKMDLADALFESQSGFSTTGATVIADLEDPLLVPHCILFWRSSSHFLGGLGIIVLFVSILGQGSAGKALMRAEMPGPSKEGSTPRMQHTAWLFAGIYTAANLVLTLILWAVGMSLFDAICHAFGTMATGGFSTFNASLGHFYDVDPVRGSIIEYVVILFMLIAGMNFTLLYLFIIRQPHRMWSDVEWRTYMAVIFGVTALLIAFGTLYEDFQNSEQAFREGLFQVVSVMTTTGFGTADFDRWNSFARGVLFLLMFVGGCAGSTGGGMKVIRHILFLKILRLEIEQAYRPRVVRPLTLGGQVVEDKDLRKTILVYFGLVIVIFMASWITVVTIEPDSTWGETIEHKLIDSASGVAATLNNIGPGLGTVGATQNYTYFSPSVKLLFTLLMMLGRLELFTILVLFSPRFWRRH